MLGIDISIAIPLIFIVAGIILILFGAMTYKNDKIQLYIKRCNKTTEATVDGFDDRKAIVRKKRDYYYYEKYAKTKHTVTTYTTPIFLFKAIDGEQYRVTYLRPIEKKLNIGQKMKISYNPENPYEIVVHGDKHMQVNSKTAIELGFIMFVAGIVLYFIK